MDSSSKLQLSLTQLEALAKHAFGQDKEILKAEENRDGWFNALYALTVSDVGDVFLKAAPPAGVPCLRYEKDIIKTEIAVLKMFEDNDGIPAPKVLVEDDSRRIIESEYFIMERLEGTSYASLREKLEDCSRIEEEKGRINRAINLIKGESFGLYGPDRPRHTNWKEAYLGLVDDILTDAEEFRASLPLPPEKISTKVGERAGCLESITEPSLIHWDLHDGNILIGADGSISGIIDCDRAMWGDPAIEFFHSALFPSGEDFYRGYGSALKESEDFDARRELYDLYLTLIFVTECQSREVKDKNHRDWAEKMLSDQLKNMKIMD